MNALYVVTGLTAVISLSAIIASRGKESEASLYATRALSWICVLLALTTATLAFLV